MNAADPSAPPTVDVALPLEQRALPLAARWERFVAAIFDSIVLGIIQALLAFLVQSFGSGWLNPGLDGPIERPTLISAMAMLLFVLLNAPALHKRGQTIGKAMLEIRIVRRDGKPLTFWRILGLRMFPIWSFTFGLGWCAKWFSVHETLLGNLATFLMVGNLVLIFRRSKACLHDDIAGTKVVSTTPEYPEGTEWRA